MIRNNSGFKGVYIDKSVKDKKYKATLAVAGKQLHLGRFDTAEEAHSAYCKAAKEIECAQSEYFNAIKEFRKKRDAAFLKLQQEVTLKRKRDK